MYITFEGPEACGKSTQARLLADYLEGRGDDVFLTKEPGSPSDPVCQKIRALILDQENDIDHKAAFFLFLADRAQHMTKIREVLARGGHVISDRSSLSTLVYYMAGIKEDSLTSSMSKLSPMLSFAQNEVADICFVCSADYGWCESKLKERAGTDRIESFDADFHHRVHGLFSRYVGADLESPGATGERQYTFPFEPKKALKVPSASEHSAKDINTFIIDNLPDLS